MAKKQKKVKVEYGSDNKNEYYSVSVCDETTKWNYSEPEKFHLHQLKDGEGTWVAPIGFVNAVLCRISKGYELIDAR